jgi:transglutaminase-like putative cysteine protease
VAPERKLARSFAMRTLLLLSCLLPSGLLLSGCGDPVPPARSFRFTYEATIPAPPDTKLLHVWLPLPHEDPGVQEVRDLQVTAPPGHEITVEPVFGNRMVHAAVALPEAPVQLSWSAVITRYEDRGQGSLPEHPRHLEATRLVPIDGPALALAEQLAVTDPQEDRATRVDRIYDDVLQAMRYDKTGAGWGRGDFVHAVEICTGNCTDFHARFIGVARASGIPARFTMGIPLQPEPQGTYDSYHCWAHWSDGKHWYPVDISEADKVAAQDPARAAWFNGHLTVDRVGLTFGRDLTLAPPQQGEPLNFFVFPYAEADGTPVPLSKGEHWRFTWSRP